MYLDLPQQFPSIPGDPGWEIDKKYLFNIPNMLISDNFYLSGDDGIENSSESLKVFKFTVHSRIKKFNG